MSGNPSQGADNDWYAAEAVVEELRKWSDPDGDIEAAHSEADKLLVNFIRELGWDKVADAFEAVPKWYA